MMVSHDRCMQHMDSILEVSAQHLCKACAATMADWSSVDMVERFPSLEAAPFSHSAVQLSRVALRMHLCRA